ncbi:MAG: response regulator [Desulfobacterales bacterium]|nr:response regulator [Desulfobacterales bacterium]
MSFHMRLQTKLLLVVSVLIVLVALITSGLITLAQKQRLTKDTFLFQERDAGYLSRRIDQDFVNRKFGSIQRVLGQAMAQNPEMLFFEVQGVDGVILLASDTRKVGRQELGCTIKSNTSKIAYQKGAFTARKAVLKEPVRHDGVTRGEAGEEMMDTCTRLFWGQDELGCLRIGYSKRGLQAHIREVGMQVLGAGVLILMTVITSVVVLIRAHIAPLVALNKRLSALREGAREESIPELLGSMELYSVFEKTSTTEIRELALSFGALSDILVKNWQSQENHRYDLEKNVTERTAALRRANRALLREITEKKSAEKRLQLKNSLMEALHESTLDLIRQVDFKETLAVLLKRAGNLMGMKSGFYFEYRKETGLLHMEVRSGPVSKRLSLTVEPGTGLVGRVWESQKPFYVMDCSNCDGCIQDNSGFDGLGTCVAVPIRLADNVGGVMGLIEYGNIPMEEEALAVLSRFGELASIAMSNAWLNTQLEEELEERHRVEKEKDRLFQHLLQAQKLEAIGTLAGGVAHDINNLLMAVQGNITLILNHAEANSLIDKRGRKVETLVASGSKLTSQLLGFARGGRYHVRPEGINTIVKSSLSIFGRTRKGISIRERLAAKLSNVEIDRTQMEQVLLNLYLNASHAMPDGGRLTIVTEEVHLDDAQVASASPIEPGRYVTVSVSDTGVGMDASTQSKVFDPFFTTREMGHGTGLGLASAYGIVKNHKGYITVASEEGKGTRFDIYLPASVKACSKGEVPEAGPEKGEGTILVVDDEEAIRDVVCEMLGALGYACLAAENSSGAVATFREHKDEIDLVLLDMVMPDAGGDIAYRALKKIDPDVRVILSSGYSREGRAEKIMETGCNGFIQKPFTLEHLSLEVRRVLESTEHA